MHTLSGKNDQFVEGFEPGTSRLLFMALTAAPTSSITIFFLKLRDTVSAILSRSGANSGIFPGERLPVASNEGFRGGLHNHFLISRGGGSIPIFGRFNG